MANSMKICKLAVIWITLASVLLIDPITGQSLSGVVVSPTVTGSGPVSSQLQSSQSSVEFIVTSMDMLMPQTRISSLPVTSQSSVSSQPPTISTNNFVSTGTPSVSTTILPSFQSTISAVVSPVMTMSVPVSSPSVSSSPASSSPASSSPASSPPASSPSASSPSSVGTILPTSSPTPTTDSPTTRVMTTSNSGLSMGAIIGIAAGGGAVVVLLILCLLVCCCCFCCCKSNTKEEYTVRPYGNVVVRKWDPRTQHGRPESLGESIRSTGRHSFARSSISSVGSFLRASIRRLSGKRRSGKRTSRNVVEDEVTMKVTPL